MRISNRPGFWLVCVVFVALAASTVFAAAPGLTFTTTAIRTSVANEYAPVIDGRYIAYQRHNLGDSSPNNDVYVYDLSQGTARAATTLTSDQLNPDVSYDLVVYDDWRHGNREIYLYDINEDSEVRITNKAGHQFRPRISNRTIIWHDAATASLWYRDLMEGVNKEIPGTSGILAIDFWDIDGDTVVIAQGSTLYEWPVGSDMGPNEIGTIGSWTFQSLQAHADRAAFTILSPGGLDANCISLLDGSEFEIDETPTRNSQKPDLFHRNSVWQHDGAGNENLAFSYLGESGFDGVALTNDDEEDPSVFGRRVVFTRPGTLFGKNIHMASATPEAARTSGTNRYQTAIETSKAYFDSADSAVICTGLNFPDALAAAPFAKALKAPLLLVPGDRVPSGLLDELTRLGVLHVWVIGGEDVVTAEVANTLSAGRFLTRIAGDDRYETAKAVAYYHYDLVTMSQGLPWTGYAFIARGDAFPDALAVAPVAASVNAPVLLTKTNSLPTATADALTYIHIDHPVVVGGSDVVSDSVKNQIQTITVAEHSAAPTERWEGPTRYATAVDIVSRALAANWIDLDTLGVATGANFPDALGGGAAMAHYGSPLLLVKPNEVPGVVATFMGDHDWDIGRIDVFGGTSVVSEPVKQALHAYLK